jgi:c-di-GMP-related signal transduction protein
LRNSPKIEISLSYKLLRYINSAFFGLRSNITSIKQALALLGEKKIKSWISLVAFAGMRDDKLEELAIQAIIRPKFCQSLGPYCGLGRNTEDLFLLGLLSLIDAFLDRPLREILNEIPIVDEIKKTLLGAKSPLTDIFQFVLAYEKGEWEKLAKQRLHLGIDGVVPSRLYLEAVNWGHKCFQKESPPKN